MRHLENVLEELNLTSEQVFDQSQYEGRVGSWVHICDSDNKCCWCSDEVYRLFHLKKSSHPSWELFLSSIYPEDLQRLQNAYAKALSGKSFHFVHRIVVNGKTRWLQHRGKHYAGEGIERPYLIASVHDITQLKEEKDELQVKRAEFMAINQYLSKTTITYDLNCILASAKNTIGKILDVVLVNVFILKDGKFQRVDCKDGNHGDVFSCQLDKDYVAYEAIYTGKLVERTIEEYGNKSSRDALKMLGVRRIASIPIKCQGETIAALSVSLKRERALTKRECDFCKTICGYLSAQLKNAMLHQELKKELAERIRAEADMDAVFSQSADFIAIINDKGKFERVNPALIKRLGYSKAVIFRKPIMNVIHAEDRCKIPYMWDNIKNSGTVRGFVSRCICKNGDVICLEINAKYDEETRTIIVSAKDTTSQRQAEAKNMELEKSVELEKLRSEFFANLSHEFKTPLNIIISSLDLLKLKISRNNEELYNDEYKKFVSFAYQNCYKLLRLTTNLLDATKIDHQFLKAHFEYCELVRLSEEITKSAEVYADARGISIKFSTDLEEDIKVCCDIDKFDRILLNLISNSIKNTGVGGKINVHFTENQNYFIISVRDNGEGISKGMLPYIFEKFRVTDKENAGNHDGNGIGLSIVKSLVEMHGGIICVESEEGKGSCFSFTISKDIMTEDQSELKMPNGMNYDFEVRQSRVKMELANV